MIGKDWLKITDSTGRRRLDDPKDTVRQELVTALERRMCVFPVLVGGARMPQEEELPADLQSLCRRNALEITEQTGMPVSTSSQRCSRQRLDCALKDPAMRARREETGCSPVSESWLRSLFWP